MATTLAHLAELTGGACRGDGQTRILSAATLELVQPGEITLIDSADKLPRLARTPAAATVLPPGTEGVALPSIEVPDVHAAFSSIVAFFHPPRPARRVGISPQAFVADSARIAGDVDIHPFVTIGEDVVIGRGVTIHPGVQVLAGCRIGDDVTLMPGAVLYENTIVGPRCIIHAQAVLGAYGFGYELRQGKHRLCAQLGYVELGADVEVGAGATIDRGTYGPTRIGEGTKIDNLVQIAHNCQIGKHNLICSQVGVAGSTTTGDYVVLAGQVGVRDHVKIGDRATVGAKAGVSNDVPAGQTVLGSPAAPLHDQKLQFAAIAKLPEMRKQFKALQRTVEQLQEHVQTLLPEESTKKDALPK